MSKKSVVRAPHGTGIHEVIADWAHLTPAAHAIAAPGREALSFVSLQDSIASTARILHEQGIGPGDRVATVLSNGPEAAVAFLGVSLCATSAPLNPGYSESEFDFFLSDLDAKALIVRDEDDSPALVMAAARGIPVLRLCPDGDGPAGLFALDADESIMVQDRGRDPFPDADDHTTSRADRPTPSDVALVLHTSGTTSRPKMVPLTHLNLASSAASVARTLALTPDDVCLNVMPLFHIHGIVASVLATLTTGGCVVCTPGFYSTDFFGWMEDLRPTWYSAVPTMHQTILARADAQPDISHSLRFIRSSSAALPPDVAASLERVFGVPVVEAYGMTEAAHQMACNPLPPATRKHGSVGPAAGPDVAIMADNGFLQPSGVTGEIVIRGSNVTPGYADNPDANRTAFSFGWFRTGDRGYLDEDGYLFVTGRIKELINRGGEKISPREIDEVLLAHPDVLQAVGFAVPDPRLGEDVAAAVVLRDEAAVTEAQLSTFAAARLAAFKVPRRIVFLDEIPKGPTGKLQRIGLAERLGLTEPDPVEKNDRNLYVPPSTPIQELLAYIWSDVLNVAPVSIDTHFLDLGGDSMLATRLTSRIREYLGCELSLIDLFHAPTVMQQAQIIEGLRSEQRDGR